MAPPKNDYSTPRSTKIADYNLERMGRLRGAALRKDEVFAVTLCGLYPLDGGSNRRRQREMGAIGKHETVRETLKSPAAPPCARGRLPLRPYVAKFYASLQRIFALAIRSAFIARRKCSAGAHFGLPDEIDNLSAVGRL